MNYADKLKLVAETRLPLLKDIFFNFLSDLKGERITVSAGHLAYVSLLSLVPVIMVFFMIMSAFPAFAEMRIQFEEFIFSNFVPHAGDVVEKYMTEFVSNASGMGAASIFSLLIVALLLISNIDKTFNHLWKTKVQRPLIFTLAIYWMVITLGPLLIGVSIAVSSYLSGLATFADDYTPGLGTAFLKLVPWASTIGAFIILYMIVPNRPVRAKYAFFGALLAAVLFEVTKQGFGLYVKSFPSYQVIYGALAVLPILFVWVYLSWIVVLLGAVFTYSVTMTCEAEEAAKVAASVAAEAAETAVETAKAAQEAAKEAEIAEAAEAAQAAEEAAQEAAQAAEDALEAAEEDADSVPESTIKDKAKKTIAAN